jgi:15-cis-phytoene synthase
MNVDQAYAFCRSIAHKHGANFSVGFRFLPKRKRNAVYAAYAFCRWADDIVDEENRPQAAGFGPREEQPWNGSPIADRRSPENETGDRPSAIGDLAEWQNELENCYAGRPTHPITIALADALQYFPIPKSGFLALIAGCKQDLVKTRYATFEELLEYCELVAASISDISLAIFGYKSDAAIEHGRSLSTALQLTNITRDIGDDLTRNRIYIPEDEMRQFGISEADLFARVQNTAMRKMIEAQIDRAESYFRDAEPLLGELAFDARFPTLLMGGVYATVLAKLRKDPLMAIRQRLSLSTMQKVLVVGARVLRPHFV